MQSPDPSSELAFIRSQISSLTQAFDQAVAREAPLGDLKKIFHEIKVWRDKLEQIIISTPKNSE